MYKRQAGHRLLECGMDPPVGSHLGEEAFSVGRAELLHLAVAQEGLHHRVLVAEPLEGLGVGRVTRLRLCLLYTSRCV